MSLVTAVTPSFVAEINTSPLDLAATRPFSSIVAISELLDVYVVPIGEEMVRPGRQVLRRLRDRGLRADGPYVPLRLAKALKLADQAGATRAVLVGPDEWGEGGVRVRDLQSGDERVVPLEDLE